MPSWNPEGWIIYTTAEANKSLPFTFAYRLAPWSEDEWIEYLLALHKEHCSSVMARVRADARRHLLMCNPQLWRIALDSIARHESIVTVRDALLVAGGPPSTLWCNS
jgi:SH3-like domain-containing protein